VFVVVLKAGVMVRSSCLLASCWCWRTRYTCRHSRWRAVLNAVGAGVGGGALVFGGVGPFIVRVGAGVVLVQCWWWCWRVPCWHWRWCWCRRPVRHCTRSRCSSVRLFAGSSWYLSALVVGVLLPFIFHVHLHRGRWWDRFVLAAFVLAAFVLLSSLTAQLSCRTS